MRNGTLILLTSIMLLLTSATSYAIFPVKAPLETIVAAATTESTPAPVNQVHHPSRIARLFHPDGMDKPHDPRPGWPGVAALVCGVVGFFPGAIIFGIVGLNKRYKNHGLALAGLILGIAGFILTVVVIVLIINAIKIGVSGVI